MVTQYRDRKSAETLILGHLPDIATLCNRMFFQTSDAQDATHEAVLEILHALPSYRGEGPVRHWLLKVALNAARMHRRKLARKGLRETTMDDPQLAAPDPGNPQDARDQQEALRSAIAELPDKLREPVILHYYHKLTQVEIGKLLSCSQKTVSQRLKQGLDRIERGLAGNASFGAVAATPLLLEAMPDPVSPTLTTAVKASIGSHFSAAASTTSTTAATTTGAPSQVALGNTIANAGITSGGIIMQTKLIVGGVVLALSCLVGGAVLSNQVFTSEAARIEVEDGYRAKIADLEGLLDTERTQLLALKRDHESSTSRVSELASALEGLRSELDDRDASIAALELQLTDLLAAEGDPASELSRTEHWDKIQDMLSDVWKIMIEIDKEGANQFELGPRLVAELAKLTDQQFEEIVAFDEDETDLERMGVIRAVMINAFTFVPHSRPQRDEYMERYLQRVEGSAFGEGFAERALTQLCFSMPPYVDGYKNLVEPLDAELKAEFLDVALDRAARGGTDGLRRDGVKFLERTSDPKATEELMRVFEQTSNAPRLRRMALRGLSTRADEGVLRFLREQVTSERDPQVLAQLKKAVDNVEKLVTR